MNIGSKVKYKSKSKYGVGKIVDKDTIFGENYFEVSFSELEDTIKLTEQDLELILDPATLLQNNKLDTINKFKLKAMAHQLETNYSGDSFITSVNFKIKPLPHQLLALNFVLNRYKHRCLLADEVGLGKTIEAALIFQELKLREIAERILIITPAGLTRQWQEELKLKFSDDFYLLNREKANALFDLYGEEGNIWDEFDQVITSIDYLKPKRLGPDLTKTEYERREKHNQRIFEDCINSDWDVVIFDEAHKLTKYKSGKETARYKLGEALSEVAPIYLLLTATPHSGKSDVFQNLLKLIDPHLFYSKENLIPEKVKEVTVRNKKRAVVDMEGNRLFKKRITTICKISRENEEYKYERELYKIIVDYVSEYYNLAKFEKNYTLILLLMLYQRIVSSSTWAIQSSLENRLESLEKIQEVSKSLNSMDMEEFIELNGEEQIDFIEENIAYLDNPRSIEKEIDIIKNCISVAGKSNKNHQDAKFNHMIEIIDEVKRRENNPDIKFIIFSEFIKTQEYIEKMLTSLGYSTAKINGSMSLDEKIYQKTKFRNDAQFLISTDAGGEGINLQFCAHMINYDLPWNPMRLEQRIGRIDRIGQKRDVKIFNFVLEGTVEEYVYNTLESKLKIIKEQFGEDKLRDILSTLQEEFNFDKLYFEAVVNREKEIQKLEKTAEEIHKKANQILEDQNFMIPFADNDKAIDNEDKKKIKNIPDKVKEFIELFLEQNNMELQEYSNQDDIFYFKNQLKNNVYRNRFSKVIFNPEKGLDNEEADLFSLRHNYVEEVLDNVKENGLVSSFEIKVKRFQGISGILGYWKLIIDNNFDYKRLYYIPIFIDNNLKYNRRISRLFKSIDRINFDSKIPLPKNLDMNLIINKAEDQAEIEAKDYFFDTKLKWQQKLDNRKEEIEKYFSDKKEALETIKIDNIRESRLKSAEKEFEDRISEINDKLKLFPKLECEQLAYIEFR